MRDRQQNCRQGSIATKGAGRMARQREVATLWIGGRLSWLEQLCLKSFVDRGQQITLFSYEPIPNVPEGVICRDGREIIDTQTFLKYEKKDSFALFADLFRLHMIRRCPGVIWVDTDVYCLRPLDYDDDHVLGFELPGRGRVNNAVLGLPADSPMLAAMLDFTADLTPIPPFLPQSDRAALQEAAARGAPVPVTQLPWGVWGPMMITHFVHQFGLADRVQPLQAFYPVTFPNRTQFLRKAGVVDLAVRRITTGMHVWASNKREMGKRFDGLPPPGSWFERACQQHGIRPALAPIASRGGRVFDTDALKGIAAEQVGVFGDVGGQARAMALAAHLRWSCDIDLIDLGPRGDWPAQPADWIAGYRDFLLANGVPADRIRRAGSEAALRRCDLVANLSMFGDTRKIGHLAPVLARALGPGSLLVTDIRKGSGSYPVLKPLGTVEPLSQREVDGAQVTRALLRVAAAPPAAGAPAPDWPALAAQLAGPEGFVRDSADHSMLFIPRSRDTLVVTFDNLDIAMGKREDRLPWGHGFIEKQGWSMLGVMAHGWTWYRDDWVAQQFDDLRDSGFFAGFGRVVFYGASMGGYAACAFAPAAAGAPGGVEVLAISPQSTLDKTLVPWETRYKTAWGRDFTGPYGDAAQVSRAARRVTLMYDPYEPLDAAHVARFDAENVVRLRAPLLGHRLGTGLQQMGVLSPIVLGALNGTLTPGDHYRLIRARRDSPRYHKELFQRLLDRGHTGLARRLGRWVLTRGDSRFIRKKLAELA